MAAAHATTLTRRSVIAVGAAAVGGALVSAVARPAAVSASDGQAMQVGGEYSSDSVTKLTQSNTGADAFAAIAKQGTGVYGESAGNPGVKGESTSNAGVFGHSDEAAGVQGESSSSNLPGVLGSSGQATGVVGLAGYGVLVNAPAHTGLYGVASGNGADDRGVFGAASTGRGVSGTTASGYGGYFEATGSGVALRTVGRVAFESAGTATIAAATKSKKVTPSIALTPNSRVFCTLQGNPGGSTTVQRVAINAAAGTFTIYLTAKATVAVAVAWFIIG